MDSGKNRRGAKALSISCYEVTDLLRIGQTQLVQMWNLTQPAISQAATKGEGIHRSALQIRYGAAV